MNALVFYYVLSLSLHPYPTPRCLAQGVECTWVRRVSLAEPATEVRGELTVTAESSAGEDLLHNSS